MASVQRARYKPNLVQTVKTSAFSTASTTFTDVTGLSVTITPRSNSSKVLVTVSIYTSNTAAAVCNFNLVRGATDIAVPLAGAYAGSMSSSIPTAPADETVSLTFLDSPATIAATTYKIQMRINTGTGYVCRRSDLTSVTAVSVITVQEIEQ